MANRGPQRDIVQLNAAAAIVAGGKADSIPDGLEVAAESIESGKRFGEVGRARSGVKFVSGFSKGRSVMHITSTNYTVADYCQAMERKEIIVNRDYQRSDKVWPPVARSFPN